MLEKPFSIGRRLPNPRGCWILEERKLEPQITIGLLVDSSGFPLEIQIFEGNRAEVKTILPVLAGFRERHKNITVTTDAVMLSAGNISELEQLGYNYITGSRLAKMEQYHFSRVSKLVKLERLIKKKEGNPDASL